MVMYIVTQEIKSNVTIVPTQSTRSARNTCARILVNSGKSSIRVHRVFVTYVIGNRAVCHPRIVEIIHKVRCTAHGVVRNNFNNGLSYSSVVCPFSMERMTIVFRYV